MWKLLLLCCICFMNVGAEKRYINFGGFACPREERALGECLKDALNTYIPQLATGVPQFGVPPCEPLHIPAINVKQSSGPISVTSSYHDVTVSGPSLMRIKDLEVDAEQHRVTANLYIPELQMKGNYMLSGQLLMLPIEGEGQFSSEYGDIDAVVNIKLGRQLIENEPDALTCEDLDVKFHVGDASIHLDNLFGGEGELGGVMNQFVNDNWQQLSKDLQSPMEAALRDFLKPLVDHAFATLNADDILSN